MLQASRAEPLPGTLLPPAWVCPGQVLPPGHRLQEALRLSTQSPGPPDCTSESPCLSSTDVTWQALSGAHLTWDWGPPAGFSQPLGTLIGSTDWGLPALLPALLFAVSEGAPL